MKPEVETAAQKAAAEFLSAVGGDRELALAALDVTTALTRFAEFARKRGVPEREWYAACEELGRVASQVFTRELRGNG